MVQLILAIIPARGGSKTIPRKNIKMIAGKPLIAYTIESALESKLIDKVVVSTEDEEIAEISKKYGAEVIMRPPELATDESLVIDTFQHVAKQFPKTEAIVVLQPTSPIRNDGLIDKCIKYYLDNPVDSVATGFDCKFEPYGATTKRRQDTKGFFYGDGNVYVIDVDLIIRGLVFSHWRGQVYTSREENVEIDDEFDFWLCEQILLKRRE